MLAGGPADPDNINVPATGLGALAEIDDIAIVAVPDTVALADLEQRTAVQDLLGHCQLNRYRIAVVDPPPESSISEVREFRSQFDSKYGALYYPWLRIVDPTRRPDPGMPPPTLDIPPSGAVAGIYARSDIERGVHKAPANEVVLGITDFTTNVTYDRQSVLNPEGINALRFFEGRARRVWGARTMSSDPEWKYVNVRRLFIYLEHSIDKSTQWAVFEPNNERLWASVRQTIEDFLIQVWTTGALMGTKPEEAFFVRCDRSTMTQNDLDNGRLICLIGVAPTYPAEFVIFRIGQWTADSRRS
jgi:phage tail sheath protein FI